MRDRCAQIGKRTISVPIVYHLGVFELRDGQITPRKPNGIRITQAARGEMRHIVRGSYEHVTIAPCHNDMVVVELSYFIRYFRSRHISKSRKRDAIKTFVIVFLVVARDNRHETEFSIAIHGSIVYFGDGVQIKFALDA